MGSLRGTVNQSAQLCRKLEKAETETATAQRGRTWWLLLVAVLLCEISRKPAICFRK